VASSCFGGASGPSASSDFGSVVEALGIEDRDAIFTDLAVRGIALNEVRIQQCMLERGFEYRPEPVSVDTVFEPLRGAGLDEAAFAREWGLGIAPVAVIDSQSFPDEDDTQTSSNEELLAELSENEREAWFVAFDGGPAAFGRQDLFEQTCVYQANQSGNDTIVTELQSDLDELEARIAEDSRMVEAERVWSSCMLEQGFDYATELAMRNFFFDQVRDARASPGVQEAGDGPSEALLRVADMERQVAQAALACTPDKDRVEDQVRSEVEGRYLSSNGDLVEQVRQIGE